MNQQPPFLPPLSTAIDEDTRDARITWYLEHKKPQLDKVVKEYAPGQEEKTHFSYGKAKYIRDFFSEILENKQITGIRIYFASYTDVVPCGEDAQQGKLELIFVPTIEKGGETVPAGDYYLLNGPAGHLKGQKKMEIKKLEKRYAWFLIKNYLQIKRRYLFETLAFDDQTQNYGETKYVFFNRIKLDEIILYIDTKHPKTENAYIFLASYTNREEQTKGGPLLTQRMTILFVFADDVLTEKLKHPFKGIFPAEGGDAPAALDTGNPTPPF